MSEIMTILAELQTAAARKWHGDPSCQQAGLFARAAAKLERLTHENVHLRECVRTARADEAHCWARRVDGLTQALHAGLGPRWWNCATHGRAQANDWGCPGCVRELRTERDALKATLRDEIDENLRLRELGGALPDENITAMTERLIRERDDLRAELHREHADHKQTLADVDTLVAAERERCVKRCIDIGQTGREAAFTADRCVAAIRSAE